MYQGRRKAPSRQEDLLCTCRTVESKHSRRGGGKARIKEIGNVALHVGVVMNETTSKREERCLCDLREWSVRLCDVVHVLCVLREGQTRSSI